ncbi:hypothetical protein ACFLY4_04690 [Chloroflexota bacterium]
MKTGYRSLRRFEARKKSGSGSPAGAGAGSDRSRDKPRRERDKPRQESGQAHPQGPHTERDMTRQLCGKLKDPDEYRNVLGHKPKPKQVGSSR